MLAVSCARVHDFGHPRTRQGGAPRLHGGRLYGIYDIANNVGWVNLGINRDTAVFSVESIRRWWYELGIARYPTATRLLITADCGGSNGVRLRLWKWELQALADELGISITVCHLPPGTSKWNRIEHRQFAFITQNWRGKPLVSHAVIVQLIANTTTDTGHTVACRLDDNTYVKGLKVSDAEMATLNVHPANFRRHPRQEARRGRTGEPAPSAARRAARSQACLEQGRGLGPAWVPWIRHGGSLEHLFSVRKGLIPCHRFTVSSPAPGQDGAPPAICRAREECHGRSAC
jgi:Rhodopirellula transposase DDE domain